MDETPHWINIACQRWGRQKRRVWAGGDWYIDREGRKRRHVDGYARSFLAKLVEERVGSGHRDLMQIAPEVFSGDGLDVQRSIPGMPEISWTVLHLHFVFDPDFGLSSRDKATLVEISVRSYWRGLELAKIWLWSRLEVPLEPQHVGHNPPPVQVPVCAHVNFRPGLQSEPKRRMRVTTLASVRNVCLESMHRPTLSLTRESG